MRRRHHRWGLRHLALVSLWALTGCLGGLDNDLFTGSGSVQGQLQAAVDPDRAWVTVAGQPELVAGIDADGRFALAGVPAGEITLLASTGLGEAVRQQVTVLAREHNQLQLQTVPGAVLSGSISLAGDDLSRRPEVGFVELPVQLKADADGAVSFSGLPEGCFELWASHPTHQRGQAEVCLQPGATEPFSLHLSRRQGGGGQAELCVPCEQASDCASGQCSAHSSSHFSEQVCTRSCATDDDCPRGYQCEELDGGSERVCLPGELSCTALANLGASCSEDLDCGLDPEDGHCEQGRCVLGCEEAHDCPGGMQCLIESGETEGLCQ